jgi:fucose permease
LSLIVSDSGIGAFASPFAATQFAQIPRWSFHYLISLGIAVTNAISLIAIFRFKTQHGKAIFRTYLSSFDYGLFAECLVSAGEPEATESGEGRSKPSLQMVFKMKAVHLLAFFVLIYVGVEVTIGGS